MAGKNANVMGVRCSASDFSLVALSGQTKQPCILEIVQKKFPIGYAISEKLVWFRLEVAEFIDRNKVAYLVIKEDESVRKSKSSIERAYNEGIVFFVAGEKIGKAACRTKRKVTIAKDLGLKGKAKYLETLDTTCLPQFGEMSDKLQEAVLCAWSELPQQ